MILRACPECTSEHLIVSEHGTLVCHDCGALLTETVQVCPRCSHVNDPDANVCTNCAEPLSVVDRVLSRQAIAGKPRWLQEAREQARGIKDTEEASSQQRFEKLVEADRQREEALRISQEQQIQQERRTLSITIASAALFLVIIVIATLVITLRG